MRSVCGCIRVVSYNFLGQRVRDQLPIYMVSAKLVMGSKLNIVYVLAFGALIMWLANRLILKMSKSLLSEYKTDEDTSRMDE